MENCIFCKIISEEIPSKKLFENKYAYAFLDAFPAAKGHSLVISKKHYETLLEIPEKEMKEISIAIQKVSKAAKKASQAEGFNIIQNNGEAAGQSIKHVHFHIVPRFKNDGLKLHFT